MQNAALRPMPEGRGNRAEEVVVHNEFVSARRNGFGMFAIRENGVAQSGMELCRELEKIAE